MQISTNFTLAELICSPTAKRKGINNTPTEKVTNLLVKLVKEILQPIRDAYGKPIIVSSGYRCPKLNTVVGGAKNSDHKFGAAVDMHSLSDSVKDNKELFDLCVKLAKDGKIKCRQIIDEYGYNWVHISINHQDNAHKDNQILHLTK